MSFYFFFSRIYHPKESGVSRNCMLEKTVKLMLFLKFFCKMSFSNLTNKYSCILCSLPEHPRQKVKRIT